MRSIGSAATGAPRTVGVLGGMGPLATIDFLGKLVAATAARCDQEHVPMLVRFCPEVPDRADALQGRGASPLPTLVAAARDLQQGGAMCLAMPCNTAHAWYDEIAAAVSIPVMHIADATVRSPTIAEGGAVGLLATTGTLAAAIYHSRRTDIAWLTPGDQAQEQFVMAAIRAIKAHRLAQGRELLRAAAAMLVERGARSIVMACTEIPLVLADQDLGVRLIDPTQALAEACVQWAGARFQSREPAQGAHRAPAQGVEVS